MSETTNAVAPKLTRAQKLTARAETLKKRIEADTAEYNDIAAELNSLQALANAGPGTQVEVRIGRADTARLVLGVIAGVKEEEDGARKFKVQYGSGFDADVVVVTGAQITKVIVPEVAENVAA